MTMPGRKYNLSNNYRYGFNGQEKSDDVTVGNYNAEYWEYDSRIGRRWNIDPINKGGTSPYSAFNNSPLMFSDPLGLDTVNSFQKAGTGDVVQHQHGTSNFL